MDFLTPGYEDLELSTQLVIKEALARGARVEVLDRADNFILIERGGRREYVKQATRTGADSYVSALVMENKEVSKIVLSRAGVHVPAGSLRFDTASALDAARPFAGRELVIKPRSTNFGEGVSMLGPDWTPVEARAAIMAALALDSSVILEEFAPGREFRFLVIGGRTRAVLHPRAGQRRRRRRVDDTAARRAQERGSQSGQRLSQPSRAAAPRRSRAGIPGRVGP